jgi:hypothetical protein
MNGGMSLLVYPAKDMAKVLIDVEIASVVLGDPHVIRGALPTPAEMVGLTRTVLAEAAASRLRPVVGQTFPLV